MSNVVAPADAGKVIDLSTREILQQVVGALNEIMEQLNELLPSKEEESVEEAVEPSQVTLKLSHLAVRDDGALLVSLEDAEDRDPGGRVVIPFMVLTEEESLDAREASQEGMSGAASLIVGGLPRKA